MKLHKTLILDKKTVEKLINIKQSIKAVESAFREYALGRARMPAKIYLDLPEYNGDFRAMPALLKKSGVCSLKWVNAHPDNPSQGYPNVMGVLILSNPKNGLPICIMDATVLTNYRTGAAGAVAAKYLARKKSDTVALVGCGVQAQTQFNALKSIFKIKRLNVWGHKPDIIDHFIKQNKFPKDFALKSKNIQECVREADIVVTTTPSRKPIVMHDWLKKGVHINAIGADAVGKQELDPKILKKGKVIVDDWVQASHSGEINVALSKRQITKRNIHANLGEVIAHKKSGRVNNSQITIFDSTGLAIQDTAVANLLYKSALRSKMGKKVQFI